MVKEKLKYYDVLQLARLKFLMKGRDRLTYSIVLSLEDALEARKLFYELESNRQVKKRDTRKKRKKLIRSL